MRCSIVSLEEDTISHTADCMSSRLIAKLLLTSVLRLQYLTDMGMSRIEYRNHTLSVPLNMERVRQ